MANSPLLFLSCLKNSALLMKEFQQRKLRKKNISLNFSEEGNNDSKTRLLEVKKS